MTSKERFYSTMEYKGVDRPCTRFYGTPEITQQIEEHYGFKNYEELSIKLGDDFRMVGPSYIGPELKKFEDGSWEGIWGERYANYNFGNGTYPETVFLPFKDVEDVEQLNDYRFPSADWFDYSTIKEQCERFKDFVIVIGDPGTPDYLNGIARCRGVEQVLFDVALEDPVFIELIRKRHEFYYEYLRRILEVAEGAIDVVWFGEDLGTQNALVISPLSYNKLFAPSMKEFFSLAHKYGARTMMHSCGSCYKLIPRLIELGLDILDVVQVDAADMNIEKLHNEFYGKITFCGSISVQNTLPFGTEEDIRKEVRIRKELFKDGGIIIGPTHEIQVGTPIKNIISMYDEIGSLKK